MTRRCSVLKNAVIVIPSMFLFATLALSACKKSGSTAAHRAQAVQLDYKSNDEMEASKVAAGTVQSSLAFTAPVVAEDEAVYAETPPAPPADIPKKIIKEGTIRYSVRDYKHAYKELTDVIARSGGNVINEVEHRSDVSWETALDIRVPADKFDSCLNMLAGVEENLLVKSVTSKDVTEEYVDLAARMKARKEVEQRYLDILKQAKTVKDILEVEEQLKSIREEVEAAQGRLQYIDHNVAMSVIHLSFFQTFSNTTPQGPGFFSSIFFSIKDGWNSILAALISFTALWPVWVVAAVLFIIIRRYRKRRRLARAAA
ncbi:DUF4349 domain-containing protein [Chitinophaga filiformis]|uniref:DUF4349 domain-containing protein n=1 Tax=Chitinophaga filiformis TaxID=104663 RepID=UPI001F16F3D8|nr:DUF4349 domain-containing protein [Chitinophaga filiformis]MCF6404241.1 DUF4349 domain-containing protein [Chitinophaga filiformis]